MRRARKIPDELRSAAFAASKDYPDGYYRAGKLVVRSIDDIREARGHDAEVGKSKAANKWPLRGRMLMVDRLAMDSRLVAHVETATGPLRWARSTYPVLFPAGKGSPERAAHVAIGFRGHKRVAIVAPLSPGFPEAS